MGIEYCKNDTDRSKYIITWDYMIAGRPIEPFIRALITGVELRPRPPDELAELLRQLSGIAVNINQIAKVANASGFVRMEDIEHIKAMQQMLWQAVKEL